MSAPGSASLSASQDSATTQEEIKIISPPVQAEVKEVKEVKAIPRSQLLEQTITCVISGYLFHTPVRVDCNELHVMEEDYAKKILAGPNKCCSFCRGPITKFTVNRELQGLTDAYFKEHPELVSERYVPGTLAAEEKKAAEEARREVKTETPTSNPLDAPYIDLSPAEMAQQRQMMDEIGRRNQLSQVIGLPLPAQVLSQTPVLSATLASQQDSSRATVENKVPPVQQGSSRAVPETKALPRTAFVPLAGPNRQTPVTELKNPPTARASRTSGNLYGHLIKLLLIGDSNAGKSELLLRFCDDSFSAAFITTIGIDFKIKTLDLHGEKIRLQIWDTAGQERFRDITTAYYRGCQGIFLVYNVTDESTFQNIRNWKVNIERHAAANLPIILLGTHCDDEDARVVTRARGQALADELRIPFFECSARANINVTEAFLALTQAVIGQTPPAPERSVSFAQTVKDKCLIM